MGEWKRTAVSGIASVSMGQSPDSSSVNEVERGTPFLQGNADFGELHPTERYWCSRPRKTARAGNLLVSVRAPVGEINVADKEYCIGRGLAAIDFWGVNNSFSRYAFAEILSQLHTKSQGTTFLAVGKKDIDDITLSYPVAPEEQRKIAEVLSTLDEAIDKTRALVEKYKNVKAGLMQDLLGKTVGEFSLLSELADTESGGTPSRAVPGYFGGNVPWVITSELNDSFVVTTNECITLKGLRSSSAKVFPEGTVLMAMYGATIGKLGILAIDAATNQACCAFFCNGRIDSRYLYYRLLFMREELVALGSGAGQPNISQTVIKKLKIGVPSKPEQLRVVEQLTAADERIQTEHDYLAKLQNIKLGLMQDLLTNTVSVDTLL